MQCGHHAVLVTVANVSGGHAAVERQHAVCDSCQQVSCSTCTLHDCKRTLHKHIIAHDSRDLTSTHSVATLHLSGTEAQHAD
jgi:hypothetical protein